MTTKLPTSPGPHIVNVNAHCKELFELDKEIFNNPPVLTPSENSGEFLKYLTVEHKTVTFIWNSDQGELIGYLSYEEELEIPNVTELIVFGIRTKFKAQGYGEKMVTYYLDLFKTKHSRLVTHPDNIPAIKLYKKMGYVPVKIIKNYFGDGQSRLLYFRPCR